MKKDDSARLSQEENDAVESLLHRYGELWTDSVASDSDRQVSRFQQNLANQTRLKEKRANKGGWFWTPGWAVAAAACLLAIVFLPGYLNSTIGGLTFTSGTVTVDGQVLEQGHLKAGNHLIVAKGGEAMLSLDESRVDLFLREGAEISLDSIDTVTLAKGDLWVRVDPNSGYFGISTPHGQVEVHGTTFGVSVDEKETRVEIAAGKVSVSNSAGNDFIEPGMGATLVGQDQSPSLHPTNGDVTPAWATDIFDRAAVEKVKRFFPSAAPKS